jgi:HEAT repeat protein
MKDEVKGEQGLAALALGKFEDEYEIEGIRQIFEKEGDFSKVY